MTSAGDGAAPPTAAARLAAAPGRGRDPLAPLGRAIADELAGRPATVRVRGADGRLGQEPAADWLRPGRTATERLLLDAVVARVPPGGRILDVGCGAGRTARWLAARGYAVDAIDASPAMVTVARAQGVPARVRSVWRLGRRERYAAALLLGNTVGLVETVERLPRLLHTLAGVADLVALDSGDREPTPTRFRFEYGGEAGGWLTWVHVPPAALRVAAAGAGFAVELVRAPAESDRYGAILTAAAAGALSLSP